jgi:hypothetical protein
MATKPAPLSTFTKPTAPTAQSAPATSTGSAAPAGDKLRQKIFRVTPAQDRKLKEYCAHADTTIQEVAIEGINMVLKSKGLPPI